VALSPRLARPAAAALDAALRRLPLTGSSRWGFELGLAVARVLQWTDRRTDERIDVSRAGRALLVAEPRSIGRLARRLPHGTVIVSGTNGKTTTTNLLADLLTAAGHQPVVNRIGANMAGGVAAELLAAARIGGRMDGDIGVFEVDELWLDRLLPELEPRALILTNLFRDQLDRMGEVDQVAAGWEALVSGLDPSAALVVCADDPRLALVGDGRERVVRFGLTATATEVPAAADLPDCRRCASPLTVAATHIGHLGDWRCPSCGDARREPELLADAIGANQLDRSRCTIVDRSEGTEARVDVELPVPGRFNVANALAAVAGARVLGVPLATAAAGLRTAQAAFGRAERLQVQGHEVVVLLAKNPVGLDEVLSLLTERGPVDLLFLLNDRDIDGRDVSWIWDGDLESLAGSVRSVTCGGARGADIAMRLDYAGVPIEAIELVEGIEAALDRALARAEQELLVIANYTAMLDVRELVAEQGFAPRYWW
jgi:UDP-N-acetylmuramyl tripeptide synthase